MDKVQVITDAHGSQSGIFPERAPQGSKASQHSAMRNKYVATTLVLQLTARQLQSAQAQPHLLARCS
jgi:hypothetical protein